MTVAQIKSMLQRQMSTHQSTLCVLEAVIDYLAEQEAAREGVNKPAPEPVPAASATQVAPESPKTAEAPAPPKAKARKAAAAQEK